MNYNNKNNNRKMFIYNVGTLLNN